jgi:ATP synthase I chain
MASIAAATATGVMIAGRFSFAAGFAVGAAISTLAYLWLHEAVAHALARGESATPKGMVFKLVIRYPLAVGIVFLFYRMEWLPFTAILLGLFVPVAGATGECLLLAAEALFRR